MSADDDAIWAKAMQVSGALVDTLDRLKMPDIIVAYGAAGILLSQLRAIAGRNPGLAKGLIEGLCYELATIIDG